MTKFREEFKKTNLSIYKPLKDCCKTCQKLELKAESTGRDGPALGVLLFLLFTVFSFDVNLERKAYASSKLVSFAVWA